MTSSQVKYGTDKTLKSYEVAQTAGVYPVTVCTRAWPGPEP